MPEELAQDLAAPPAPVETSRHWWPRCLGLGALGSAGNLGTQPSGLRCWRAGWPAPGHHLHPGGQSLQDPNELPAGGSIPARTGNGLIGLEPLGDARLPLHQCPTAKMTQG